MQVVCWASMSLLFLHMLSLEGLSHAALNTISLLWGKHAIQGSYRDHHLMVETAVHVSTRADVMGMPRHLSQINVQEPFC